MPTTPQICFTHQIWMPLLPRASFLKMSTPHTQCAAQAEPHYSLPEGQIQLGKPLNFEQNCSYMFFLFSGYRNIHLVNIICSVFINARRIYSNTNEFVDRAANLSTIPEYFKSQGYLTLSAGKILHGAGKIKTLRARMWDKRPFLAPGDKDPDAKKYMVQILDSNKGEENFY